jgi:hypothetical protein
MHAPSLRCGIIAAATSSTNEFRYKLHRFLADFLTDFLPAPHQVLTSSERGCVFHGYNLL